MLTTNKSFIEVSNLLKEKGVKNNEFMLVDDPSNIYDFLREQLVIETIENKNVDFHINLLNLEAIYLLEQGFDVYISSPRQSLGTTSILSYLRGKYEQNSNLKCSVITPSGTMDWYVAEKLYKTIKPTLSSKRMPLYKYNDNNIKDFIFIDDFEMMDKKLVNEIFKLLKYKRKYNWKTQFIFKSCVGRKGSLARMVANDIILSSYNFDYFLFDLDFSNYDKNKIVHVSTDIYDLYNKQTLERMRNAINNDESFKREILCDRTRKYYIEE